MPLNWLSNRLKSEEESYPSIEVDGELLKEIKDGLSDDNGGPLLLIRPPRENEGMDASISIYETLHNPRERKVGFGPFSAIQNNAHAHAHEIWYHDAQMQFFLRPETRVDANKVRRQVRSNYPNVDISEVDSRFPTVEVGEYISVAEIGLKRDFYFPIKAKLHNDDDFDLDPYGDITSDMVVEEDETSDGQRVEAKDCKLIVQTVFEAARDVWRDGRPYGIDVSDVAQGMKEGELHGNMLKGYDVRNPSTLKNKAAKILETLQGAKGYYITMRVIAISPYEEIAQRRCKTVSQDFETYYNSITQQGLTPINLTEDEMRQTLLEAVRREHNYGFRDRFMSNGKFLQPVEALGAIAHIPNEEINTPVIDWAKQDTGPGTPSSRIQLEGQKREQEKVEEKGLGSQMNPSVEPVKPESTEESNREEPVNFGQASSSETQQEESSNVDIPDGWEIEDENGNTSRDTDTESGPLDPASSSVDSWANEDRHGDSDSSERETGKSDMGSPWSEQQPGSEAEESPVESKNDVEDDVESDSTTPAFSSGNFDDGWGEDSDSDENTRSGSR